MVSFVMGDGFVPVRPVEQARAAIVFDFFLVDFHKWALVGVTAGGGGDSLCRGAAVDGAGCARGRCAGRRGAPCSEAHSLSEICLQRLPVKRFKLL